MKTKLGLKIEIDSDCHNEVQVMDALIQVMNWLEDKTASGRIADWFHSKYNQED